MTIAADETVTVGRLGFTQSVGGWRSTFYFYLNGQVLLSIMLAAPGDAR